MRVAAVCVVDGEQYIAVVAGAGGAAGLNLASLDYQNAGYVIAYKRGGKAKLPQPKPRRLREPDPPPLPADAATRKRGGDLYNTHCGRCHGMGTRSGGLLPDLRRAKREVHQKGGPIVLGGSIENRGMPSFADVLSSDDAKAIHAYVISQALREPSLMESAAEWLSQYACIPAVWLVD